MDNSKSMNVRTESDDNTHTADSGGAGNEDCTRIKALISEMDAMRMDVLDANKRASELSIALSQTEHDLRQKTEEEMSQRKRADELQSKSSKDSMEFTERIAVLEEKKSSLLTAATDRNRLEETIGRIKAEIRVKDEELINTKAELTNTKGELIECKSKLQEVVIDKTTLETEMTVRSSEIQSLLLKLSEVMKLCKNLSAELLEKDRSTETLHAELNEIKIQLPQTEARLMAWRNDQIAERESMAKKHALTLANRDQEIKALEAEVVRVSSLLETLSLRTKEDQSEEERSHMALQSQLNEEMNKRLTQLTEKNAEIKRLREDKDDIQAKYMDVCGQLGEKLRVIEGLESEVQKASTAVSTESMETIQSLEAKITVLTVKLEALEVEANREAECAKSLEKALVYKDDDTNELRSQMEQLRSKLYESDDLISILKNESKHTKEENGNLTVKIEDLNKQIYELQTLIKEQSSTLQSNKEELIRYAALVDALKPLVTESDTKLSSQQIEMNTLKVDSNTLKLKLNESEAAVVRLVSFMAVKEEAVNTLSSQLEKEKSTYMELETRYNRMVEHVQETVTELSQSAATPNISPNSSPNLNPSIDDDLEANLRLSVTALIKRLQGLTVEYNGQEQRLKMLDEELSLAVESETLAKQSYDDLYSMVISERAASRFKVQDIENQLASTKVQLDSSLKENDNLHRQLDAMKTEMKGFDAEKMKSLFKLEGTNTILTVNNTAKDKDIENLKLELERTQMLLSDKIKEIELLQAQISIQSCTKIEEKVINGEKQEQEQEQEQTMQSHVVIEALQQELAAVRLELAETIRQHNDSNEKCNNAIIEDYVKQLADKVSDLHQIGIQIEASETAYNELNEKYSSLVEVNTGINQSLEESQRQLSLMIIQKNEIDELYQCQTHKEQELKNEIEGLLAELKHLEKVEDELGILQVDNEMLQAQVYESEDIISVLKGHEQLWKEEIESEAQSMQIEELNDQLDIQVSELDRSETQLSEAAVKLLEIETEKNRFEAKLFEAKHLNEGHEKEISQLMSEISSLTQELQGYINNTVSKNETENIIKDMKDTIKSLQEQCKHAESRVVELELLNKTLEAERAFAFEMELEAKNAAEEYRKDVKLEKDLRVRAQTESSELKTRLEVFKSKHEESLQEIIKLTANNADLMSVVEKQSEDLARRDQMLFLQEEKAYTQTYVQQTIQKKNREIGELSEKLFASQTEVEALQRVLAALRKGLRTGAGEEGSPSSSPLPSPLSSPTSSRLMHDVVRAHRRLMESLLQLLPLGGRDQGPTVVRVAPGLEDDTRQQLMDLRKDSNEAYRALLGEKMESDCTRSDAATVEMMSRIRSELRAARAEALAASETNVTLQAELARARMAVGRLSDDRGKMENLSGLGVPQLSQRLVDKEYEYEALLQQHIATKLMVAAVSQDADEERVRVFDLTRRLQRYAERVESLEKSITDLKEKQMNTLLLSSDKKGLGHALPSPRQKSSKTVVAILKPLSSESLASVTE
eukprot:gene10789-22522_t